jgi:hypothetical protein
MKKISGMPYGQYARSISKPDAESEPEKTIGAREVAGGIIGALPEKYRQRIVALSKGPRNRHSQRAVATLVRLGLKQALRDNNRDAARKRAKEERKKEMKIRLENRSRKGNDRPLPGMSWARFDEVLDQPAVLF